MNPIETVKAALEDMVALGLRHDLNPCRDMTSRETVDQFWRQYMRSADELLRQRAQNALDALAAQSQEPVSSGWRLVPQRFVGHVLALEHNWTKLTPIPPEFCCGPDSEHWFKEAYRRCGKDLSAAKEMLDAGPQPAPPQPAVPIEKALNDVAQKAMDYARNTDFGGEDAERLATLRESKDHAARLYALASAAPQRPTVSLDDVLAATERSLSVGESIRRLRALGIEVQE